VKDNSCPCCGGGSGIYELHGPFGIYGFRVKCGRCGLTTADHGTKDAALDAWTRRPDAPAQPPRQGCETCGGTGKVKNLYGPPLGDDDAFYRCPDCTPSAGADGAAEDPRKTKQPDEVGCDRCGVVAVHFDRVSHCAEWPGCQPEGDAAGSCLARDEFSCVLTEGHEGQHVYNCAALRAPQAPPLDRERVARALRVWTCPPGVILEPWDELLPGQRKDACLEADRFIAALAEREEPR
jgi:hypothetical protein